MAVTERLKRRVVSMLDQPRFVEFAEIATGEPSGASAATFQFGSYYAHRIGNQCLPMEDSLFILSNTFLLSHAYNIALVLEARLAPEAARRALRHNFKKFFAEAALAAGPCLIGRALLIETLAFEQGNMRPIFAALAEDPMRLAVADRLSRAMGSLLNIHELSHYMFERDRARWGVELEQPLDGALARLGPGWRARCTDTLFDELCCDFTAVAQMVDGDDFSELARMSRLRLAALGFLCFGELVALEKSARDTALRIAPAEPLVELGSPIRPTHVPEYALLRDDDMDFRVACMIELCRDAAARAGEDLFAPDPLVPLDADTPARLGAAFRDIFTTEPLLDASETATSPEQRGIAQLLAESGQGHPDGDQHLLWRSKRFAQGGAAIDP